MCHRLDLRARLTIDTRTLLADLLLTKLQIAKLNEKDVTDVAALLLDHGLTDNKEGINQVYVAKVLTTNSGWWRTVTGNVAAMPAHLQSRLPGPSRTRVEERLQQLVDETPSALKLGQAATGSALT